MRILAVFFLLVLILPGMAKAQGYYGYLGLDSSQVFLDNQIGPDIEPNNIRLRIGGRLEPGWDLEAQFGFTIDSDRAFQADWSVDHASLFLKGHLPIGRYLALYGLLGGSALSVTERVDRRDFTHEELGFSYGFGVETVITDRLDISLDYVNYLHDALDYENISAISFGMKFYY